MIQTYMPHFNLVLDFLYEVFYSMQSNYDGCITGNIGVQSLAK